MTIDLSEVLRYLGAKEPVPTQLRTDVCTTADELRTAITPQYTYRLFSLQQQKAGVFLPEADILLAGRDAEKMLAQCTHAILLCCTLGVRFDAMLRARQVRDMAGAVILDACGSVWVEAGCDELESELRQRFPGRFLTDRFSPGYGDLPLSLQQNICTVLDTGRRLGVHVNERFMLNPVKSVTAVIGVSDQPQAARIRGCAYCSMNETCTLRKGGNRCVR